MSEKATETPRPNFKVKISTTFPYLKVKIYDGWNKTVAEKVIDGCLIPHYSKNQMHVYSRENSIEIELPKGLYQMRLSLPYFNPTSQDKKTGTQWDMEIVMDEFIHLSKDREFRLDLNFTYPGQKREVIRKQVGENFNTDGK